MVRRAGCNGSGRKSLLRLWAASKMRRDQPAGRAGSRLLARVAAGLQGLLVRLNIGASGTGLKYLVCEVVGVRDRSQEYPVSGAETWW